MDSSRSYANSVLLKLLWFLILFTLPIKAPLPGLFKGILGRRCVPGAGAPDPGKRNAKSGWKANLARSVSGHGALQRVSVKTLAGRDCARWQRVFGEQPLALAGAISDDHRPKRDG
jgi:hypothetical protein